MSAPTINRINAAIAHHGVELVKGNGYFWFAALPGAPLGIEDMVPSVYTCHLKALSFEDWVAHVADRLRF